MSPEHLKKRFSELFPYFESAFGEWMDSPELIAECQQIATRPVKDGKDAAAVVIAMTWDHLQRTHRIKVIK